jgi:hypothetical protein
LKKLGYAALANTLLAVSVPALAQGAFDGIDASLGISFDNITTDATQLDPNYYGLGLPLSTEQSFGETSAVGTVELGYSHAVGGDLNLGVSAFRDFGSGDAGSTRNGLVAQYTLDEDWGVAVEPGVYLSPTTLGYLKLGYARAASELQIPGYLKFQYGSAGGPLYGFGFKQLISDRLYLGMQVYRTDYSASAGLPYNGLILDNQQTRIHGGVELGYVFGPGATRQVAAPASSRSFDGFEATLGLGAAGVGTASTDAYGDVTLEAQPATLPELSIGYSKTLRAGFNLAASLFTAPGTWRAGQASASNGNLDQFTVRDIWGGTVEPGYIIAPGTLGYLKLGYAWAQTSHTGFTPTTFGTSGGYLYGLGVKTRLTDRSFVGIDAYQVNFGNRPDQQGTGTSVRPWMTYGGVSLGYIF